MKWIFKQFQRFQVFMYRRSGGKQFGRMMGMPLLLITTIGRKTGKQHVTPVMYICDGANYVVTASNGGSDKHPNWFLNLQAHPQIKIEVEGSTKSVLAHQPTPKKKPACGQSWSSKRRCLIGTPK